MPDQAAEKTEQPTPKKLSEARKKGQVPQSEELTSFVSIVVLTAMVFLLAPNLLNWFIFQVRQGLSCDNRIFADSKVFMNFYNSKIADSLFIVSPIFAALFAGSAIAGVVVSGLNFAPNAVEFKLDTINPVKGMKNLINAKSFVKLLLSILKLTFVSIIVWYYLQGRVEALAGLRWAWSVQILAVISKIILGLVIRVCLALLVIAAADVFYQKWKYIQDLKMTKQEVKQEQRAYEGSPEVKRRLRQIQYEMSLKRMIQEVPKADVVLVNPTHVAVALRYNSKEMECPMVVAKGADHLAEKIREIARAYGVPIIRRPQLARTIYSAAEPGEPIPPTLYVAVAEVLAMIYRLRHGKQSI